MPTAAENITRHFGGDWHGSYGAIPTPGHSARDRGTTVKMGDGGEVIFHAHNDPSLDWRSLKDQCRSLGLIPERERELGAARGGWRETGSYTYRDASGTVVYRTVRKEKPGADKRFEAQRLEGRQWVNGMGNVERVPYRLPELLAADPAQPVYFVEGERKADKIAGWGMVATAIPFGAKGWRDTYATHFAGRRVIVLPDNDDPGRQFAAKVTAALGSVASSVTTVELPDLPPKGDVVNWNGNADQLRALTAAALLKRPAEQRTLVSATPFIWRDPASLPQRPWVYGRWLLRNTITAVVAPGGVGKSALMASTILALATGRELLGKSIWDGPQRVWYWNLEDDGDELARQIHAAAKFHRIRPEECGDRLFVDSGLDGAALCIAVEDREGFRIQRPVVEALVAELIERNIDVLIVDPFVSSHGVSENDNGAIDAVAKEWARVAKRANCSIVLVHHTKKLAGQKVTAEMSRGAVALISAARIALVLNRMDSEEATRFGIDSDKDRRQHFNVQDDKHNRAPPEDAEWYRIDGVDLGNGDEDHVGDNIGVVGRWAPPDTFEGISADHLRRVQTAVAAGEWLKSEQSPQWVGHAVADVLGLDPKKEVDRKRIQRMLREWVRNDVLREERRQDSGKGRERPYIVVGRMVDDHSPPTPPRVGKKWGSGEMPSPPHRPLKGSGGGGVAANGGGGHRDLSRVVFPEEPAPARSNGRVILAPGETEDDPVPGFDNWGSH